MSSNNDNHTIKNIENNNIEKIINNEKSEINDIIQKSTNSIRNNWMIFNGISGNKKPREWLTSNGLCEVCGLRKATVNLELKFGSHRECQSCWED